MAVKDVIPEEGKALQDAEVNNETSEITLYVEKAKLSTNGKLDFTLLNIAEGITFTGNDDVTGTRETTPKTSVKVEIPSKIGDYNFTLTSEGKVKKVTVHVVDGTMPTSYAFRSWRDEDINSIPEEQKSVKDNTSHVKTTSGLFTSDTDVTTDITFKGNVNTMTASEDGGKYYRVRIKVEGINVEDVIAVNKDDVTKKYEVTAIDKNSNEIYVKLNANDSVVNLVLANKNASKEQIEKETKSCHKVTFESKSKIWLRDARASQDSNMVNNGAVTKVEVNAEDNHVLDIGVKFDELKGLKLTENSNGTITATKETNDLWVPVVVKVGEDNANVKDSVFANGNDNVKVDRKTGTTGYENIGIVLWVKSDKTDKQKISFTLKYNRADEPTEELPVTVVLHNASAPKIISVEAGDDDNAKALQNLKVEAGTAENRVRVDNVSVDTYRKGMTVVSHKDYTGKEVEGRWYSLKLTFNVPVESMLFNNSGNEAAEVNQKNWLPFSGVDGNTLTIWLNADDIEKAEGKTSKSVQQTVCNKWAIEVDEEGKYKKDDTSAKWTVGINVNEEEKSKTMTAGEYFDGTDFTVYNSQINTAPDTAKLEGTKLEVIKEDANRTGNNGKKYGSIEYNLEGSKKDGVTQITNTTTKGVTTAALKVNTSNLGEIKVNNKKGTWILLQLAIRGNTETIIDETKNEDAIIFDLKNRTRLLTGDAKGAASKAELIPIWVNLDNESIRAATKYASDNSDKTITPFKVSLGSTSPVEEHNYFYLTIEDSNANSEPIPENAKPEGIDVGDLDETTATVTKDQEKVAALFPEDVAGTKSHLNDDDKIKAFIHNQKVLDDFDISEEIVGDTIYMTVKGDYKQLKSTTNKTYDNDQAKDFNVAFDLDLSSIIPSGTTEACFYNDGDSTWYNTSVDANRHCHFGLTIYGKYEEIQNSTGLTKEYIFTSGKKDTNSYSDKDCSKIKGKYIRYVFTFIQED